MRRAAGSNIDEEFHDLNGAQEKEVEQSDLRPLLLMRPFSTHDFQTIQSGTRRKRPRK